MTARRQAMFRQRSDGKDAAKGSTMRPHFTTRLRRSAVLLAAAATFAGCGLFRRDDAPITPQSSLGDAEHAATRPVAEQEVITSTGAVPGALQPMNRPIVQGPLPLFYLTEQAGAMKITNADTGEEITTLDVKASQILRIETRGVTLGDELVLGAKLAPGTYAVTPLSDTAGVVRTERVRTRAVVPLMPPTSQPTETPPPATSDTPPPQ